MAKYVTDTEFKRLVRVCLDENMSSETLSALEDIDTLSLDELIESKAEDAALSVVRAAPIDKLGDVAQSLEGSVSISVDEPHKGVIQLPIDFERLVRFKMSSWRHALHDVQPPMTPNYEAANSEFAVYGTKDKPALFLVPSPVDGRDLCLEAFSAKDLNDTLDGCLYVATPKKEDINEDDSGDDGEEPKKVTGITLSRSTLSLAVDTAFPLKATVAPTDAYEKSVSWESSAPSIASVMDVGKIGECKVYGASKGSCTITCRANDGSGVYATCSVTVDEADEEEEPVAVTSVELDESTITLYLGDEPVTIYALIAPPDATITSVEWSSSNDEVASVENGEITAHSEGTCTITCKVNGDDSLSASCAVTVSKKPFKPEYVDLGLPSGTKWATCNLGAESPEKTGGYYAWGEIVAKNTAFRWGEYKWCNGDYDKLTKYCYEQSKWGKSGDADRKDKLDKEDDAAYQVWGTTWCMPSLTQIKELLNPNNTSTEWVEFNGVSGLRVTSKANGNSIFLPALGEIDGDSHSMENQGCYWSKNLSGVERGGNLLPSYDLNGNETLNIVTHDSATAHSLRFNNGEIVVGQRSRNVGRQIRPVCSEQSPQGRRRIRIDSSNTTTSGSGTSGTTSDSTWQLLLGDRLLRPTIYYAAYLTALAVKDDSGAEKLLGIAKSLIEN